MPSDVWSPSTKVCYSSEVFFSGSANCISLLGVLLQVVHHALEAFKFPFTLWCINLPDNIKFCWIPTHAIRGDMLHKNLHSLVLIEYYQG